MAILRQATTQDALQILWQRRVQICHRSWRVSQDGREHREMRVACERAHAGRQLVQEHAQGKDVRTLVDLFAFRLLRRQVVGRADDEPRLRAEPRRRLSCRRVEELGEPPSSGGELHPSALTEPDVRLSPHPARPLHLRVSCPAAIGRRAGPPDWPSAAASAAPPGVVGETVCTSGRPRRPRRD